MSHRAFSIQSTKYFVNNIMSLLVEHQHCKSNSCRL